MQGLKINKRIFSPSRHLIIMIIIVIILVTITIIVITMTIIKIVIATVIIIEIIIIMVIIYSTYPMFIFVKLAFGGHCLHFQVYTINSMI